MPCDKEKEVKGGAYISFIPRNPFMNSAVSSIKSRGRGLL